jgi:transcriptional regulator with XRE-family HTH domain
MYPALHEASEERFVYAADQIRERSSKEARLQQIRRLNMYSQKMLSERSGISLRMIQQYEQGAKDIRKASSSGILALAGTLHCDIEDLICG